MWATGEKCGWLLQPYRSTTIYASRPRPHRQVKAAEERLHEAEQETSPSSAESSEVATQEEEHSSDVEVAPSSAEDTVAGERQAQLRAIASDLLYWKGGLKVLRQAQLPKWRGSFQWQIEALQAAYARLRAEVAKEGGEGRAWCWAIWSEFDASHASAHLDKEALSSVEIQLMFAKSWFHHAHQVGANSVSRHQER